MHVHNIVPKHMDGRVQSSVCVCELLYMFCRLIFKRCSGNFSPSSSSPFPKAGNLNQRSLKMFVLQLFGKLMPFSPTLKGCCQFHPTQKVGPWTPLTSNPSNALSAVLKTEGNGG